MKDSINEQFGQIYDQYIEKIYRFVYLKVNSEEVAQDIVSKVFMKGWEAYKVQNSESKIQNVGAFLYQVARNSVVDYYRERGRTKTVSSEIVPEMIDLGTDLQDKAILSADIGKLRGCMLKLKKDHQDVLIWHYLEDMSVPEIAKLVNKPAGTVRVMIHRGLKDLRDIIQES